MIISTRSALIELIYGLDAGTPSELGPEFDAFRAANPEISTLVGSDILIGGELLDEAMANGGFIDSIFPMGDEGDGLTVHADGTVIDDFIYG